MIMFFGTVGLIILICLIFGLVMSYIFPDNSLESYIDEKRRVAKEKGLVLHMESYRNGEERYVSPRDQNIGYNILKAIQQY